MELMKALAAPRERSSKPVRVLRMRETQGEKKRLEGMPREGTSNSHVTQKYSGEPRDVEVLMEKNKGSIANWKTRQASQCLETMYA